MSQFRAYVSILSILAGLSVFRANAVLTCQRCQVCEGGRSDCTNEGRYEGVDVEAGELDHKPREGRADEEEADVSGLG
jgi:hypothetical protein